MLPRTMIAAILVESRKSLVIDEVQLPSELQCGQVCVKVKYSSICGSQLGEIDAVKGPDKYLPHLMGHEAVGEVVAIGPAVRFVAVGDTVVLHWRPGRGIETVPPVYKWQGRRLNAGFITTFNEYAIVAENRVTPIPADFPQHLAPLLGCAVTTGFGVVTNNAKLRIGESIVVFGAGGVGLSIIQAAAMTSAWPIVAIDLYDNRLSLAKNVGATHVINASTMKQDTLLECIQGIVGPSGADVVVDNTGNTNVIAMAYDVTAANGRSILVGVPRAGEKAQLYTLPLHFNKTLTGSHGGESTPDTDIPRFIRLHKAGLLDLNPLITNRYRLGEINEAIRGMRYGDVAGRCLIDVSCPS